MLGKSHDEIKFWLNESDDHMDQLRDTEITHEEYIGLALIFIGIVALFFSTKDDPEIEV